MATLDDVITLGGKLKKLKQSTGTLPRISIEIVALEGGALAGPQGFLPTQIQPSLLQSTVIDKFTAYEFDSSVLVPVDSFNFSFAFPASFTSADKNFSAGALIREGDLCYLYVDKVAIACGIIDTVEIEVDGEQGEKISISGRDFAGQLEDQDAISTENKPIYFENVNDVAQVVTSLTQNTRIPAIVKRNLPQSPTGGFIFATEPGETKIAALQRFLEPYNAIFWCDALGRLIIGKPSQSTLNGKLSGEIICSKQDRYSNVTNIKVTRAAAQIPNVILPLFVGQAPAINALAQQVITNPAPGPDRLRTLGHFVPKVVTTADPKATGVMGANVSNQAVALAGASDKQILKAYAAREIARQNQKEMIVQCTVPGHMDEKNNPYVVDTMYNILFDVGNVREVMYLYQVQYILDDTHGAMTRLFFCRLKTICADGTI